MGSITGQKILDDSMKITQDLKNRRWTAEEAADWINAGQREIVINRPDAFTVLETHVCDESATQQIPSNGMRFLEATHNLASGYSIMPMKRSSLDEVQRNWHSTDNPADEVEHYIFDDRFPKYFKVFPVPKAGTEIEIGYSATPPRIELGEAIGVDDAYANCLVDYLLARMYQKNTTLTNAAQLSERHYRLFYQSLGVKFQADQAASPANPQNQAD